MQNKIVKEIQSDSPGNTKEAFLSSLHIQGSKVQINIGFIYKDPNGMLLGTGTGQTIQFNLTGADDPNIANYPESVRNEILAEQAKYNSIIEALEPVLLTLIEAVTQPVLTTE